MLPLFMTPHPQYFLSNPTALWVTCQRSRKHALTSPSSYSHWPLSSVRLLLRTRHTKQSNDTYPLTHSSKKMIERWYQGHNTEAGPTRPPRQSSSHATQRQVKLTSALSPPAARRPANWNLEKGAPSASQGVAT